MSSKTSYFNKTLFLKTVLRMWPVWALYLGVLFFNIIVTMIVQMPLDEKPQDLAYSVAGDIANLASVPQIIVFALLSAIAVFSFLFSSRSANMMHAFPISRKESYITNFITGLLFMIVPQIVIFLISIPFWAKGGVIVGGYLLPVLLYAMGYSVIFYVIAVLCCMISGHWLATIFYYGAVNLVYIVVRCIVSFFADLFLFGVNADQVGSFSFGSTSVADVLSPAFFLMTRCRIYKNYGDVSEETAGTGAFSGELALVIYLLVFVALAVFGYVLYKKRQIEVAGNASAFRCLRPVARWGVAFCAGSSAALLLSSLTADARTMTASAQFVLFIVLLFVFTFLCVMIVQMLLFKAFKIFTKRFILEWVIGCALIAVLFAIGKVNGYGMVTYVPESDQVQEAFIENDRYIVDVDTAEELDGIINLHKCIVDNRKGYQNLDYDSTNEGMEVTDKNYTYGTYINLAYILKNGKIIRRSYHIPVSDKLVAEEDQAAYYLNIFEEKFGKEALKEDLSVDYYKNVDWSWGQIQMDERVYGEDSIQIESTSDDRSYEEAEAAAFAKALTKDIDAGYITYRTIDFVKEDSSTETFNYMNLLGSVTQALETVNSKYETVINGYSDSTSVLTSYGTSVWQNLNVNGMPTGKYDFEVSVLFNDRCKNIKKLIETAKYKSPDYVYEDEVTYD